MVVAVTHDDPPAPSLSGGSGKVQIVVLSHPHRPVADIDLLHGGHCKALNEAESTRPEAGAAAILLGPPCFGRQDLQGDVPPPRLDPQCILKHRIQQHPVVDRHPKPDSFPPDLSSNPS